MYKGETSVCLTIFNHPLYYGYRKWDGPEPLIDDDYLQLGANILRIPVHVHFNGSTVRTIPESASITDVTIRCVNQSILLMDVISLSAGCADGRAIRGISCPCL